MICNGKKKGMSAMLNMLCLCFAAVASADAGAVLPVVDLSGETHRQTVIAAGTEKDYQGHPTTLMTEDGRIIAVWCTPHGGWCGPAAESSDHGRTWKRIDDRFPAAYRRFVNCPSIYRLVDPRGKARVWVWGQAKLPQDAEDPYKNRPLAEAMPSVMSEDEGMTWKEMPPLGPKFRCVMAFASIIRRSDGSYLGMFHSGPGGRDKSPLKVSQSVSKDGGLTWSDPVLVAEADGKDLCEPYVFRSPKSDEFCCLMREDKRTGCSMMMFSRDEGRTWSRPEETPWGLTGDRHHGVTLPDGRLVVVFRDMAPKSPTHGHFVGWIGTYDAIRSKRPEGTCRVKLIHAHRLIDCGYPGIHLLPDGTVFVTTYAKYRAGKEKNSIVCTRFRMEEIDERLRKMKK